MIPEKYKDFRTFSDGSIEGKLLMAAMAILTSIDKEDIKVGRYGSMNHPDTITENIWDLANYIYNREEYEDWKVIEGRDKKIDELLK